MLEDILKKCYSEEKNSEKGSENEKIKTSVLLRIEEGKPMKRIKIKPLIIAAAATVTVALLAGFTTAVVHGKHVFSFNKGNSIEQAFDFSLESRELTIPEEFKPQDGEWRRVSNVDTPPREVFEKFGLTLPANDNFSAISDREMTVEVFDNGDFADVSFRYYLYNKTVENNVYFNAKYFADVEKLEVDGHAELLPGEPTEIITLKNGAKCLVSASSAVFSYDGACWDLYVNYDYDPPSNYGDLTKKEKKAIIAETIEAMPGIEAVKQVLADMDLL